MQKTPSGKAFFFIASPPIHYTLHWCNVFIIPALQVSSYFRPLICQPGAVIGTKDKAYSSKNVEILCVFSVASANCYYCSFYSGYSWPPWAISVLRLYFIHQSYRIPQLYLYWWIVQMFLLIVALTSVVLKKTWQHNIICICFRSPTRKVWIDSISTYTFHNYFRHTCFYTFCQWIILYLFIQSILTGKHQRHGGQTA